MPFLTPDTPSAARIIVIRTEDTLIPDFIGALLELWDAQHWELFGSMGIEDTVSLVSAAINGILEVETISDVLNGSPELQDGNGDLIFDRDGLLIE